MELTIVKKAVTGVRTAAAPVIFWARKHAPEILVGTGIASICGGTVLACKATLDARDILDSELGEHMSGPVTDTDDEGNEITYWESDPVQLKDLERKEALKLGLKAVKPYIPAAGLLIGGTSMLVAAKSIEHRRFTAALGAYSMLQATFEKYRGHIIAEQGPELDYRAMNGVELVAGTVYEEQEDGKKPKKKKAEFQVFDSADPYHRIFDECNAPMDWRNNLDDNRFFLECQQTVLNQRLKAEGRIFLSEVYKAIGFEYEPIGQFVGWLADDVEGSKDGYIDFGIDYAYLREEIAKAMDEGRNPEPSIWLNFNCDGVIWDKPLTKKYDI